MFAAARFGVRKIRHQRLAARCLERDEAQRQRAAAADREQGRGQAPARLGARTMPSTVSASPAMPSPRRPSRSTPRLAAVVGMRRGGNERSRLAKPAPSGEADEA